MIKMKRTIAVLLVLLITASLAFGANARKENVIGEDTNQFDYNLLSPQFDDSVLTYTLDGAVGLQGFEGEYALDNSNSIVEIVVQFKTPPAAVLRYLDEHDISVIQRIEEQTGHSLPEKEFADQALTAHTAFNEQLEELIGPRNEVDSIEVFGECSYVFNGVHMRIPNNMVEKVSELKEVYAVSPNIIDDPPSLINDNVYKTTRTIWDIGTIHSQLNITGSGVRVAMLDSGIDHTHPEFAAYADPNDPQGRIRGWEQHVQRGYSYTDSSTGHGSATAGSIIAMAPDIELWSFKRRSTATGTNCFAPVEAFNLACELGMDVIYTWNGKTHHPFTLFTQTVSTAVITEGVVVVVAAHNYGPDAYTINEPGCSPLAITVGAGTAGNDSHLINNVPQDTSDNIANFSGRGPVDLTYHIKPDIIAPGWKGLTTNDTTLGLGQYRLFSGTSQASPLIVGLVALLKQAYPDAPPWAIKARLMNTARALNDGLPDSVFSAGAGFARPFEALTTSTLVIAEHEVPITDDPRNAFVTKEMSSLSFGSVGPENNTLPMYIINAGTEPLSYTITYEITGSLNGVYLSFSDDNLYIQPGNFEQVDVSLDFYTNAPTGLYEGYILVYNGNYLVARLPFAANLTETISAPISISTPQISFNGSRYILGSLSFTADSSYNGDGALVVFNKYSSNNVLTETSNTTISSFGAGDTRILSLNNPMNYLNAGEYLEVLVYRNGVRQHLLARKLIQPAIS